MSRCCWSKIPVIALLAVVVALLCPASALAAELGGSETPPAAPSAGYEHVASPIAVPHAAGGQPSGALVAGSVAAQSTEAGFVYESVDGGVQITGYSGSAADLVIPAKLGGKDVVSIGDGAFYQNADIASVAIPKTVKTIKAGAFAECYGITGITLAEGVKEIGDYAFQDTAITSITIPASVKQLGNYGGNEGLAFYNCRALTEINVAKGSKSYKSTDGVLYNKSGSVLVYCPINFNVPKYVIPAGVTEVGNHAFYQNQWITGVSFPKDVTKLGDWSFCQSALKSITVPASVKTLGDGPFDGCADLAELDYKTTAEQPYRMCEGCYSLSSIELANGLKAIGFRAFKDCTSLVTLKIPASVETIGNSAFYQCESLASISIPDKVAIIENAAFGYDRNLTKVLGCKGLQKIDTYAFAYTGISSFPWGKKLRFVSSCAFEGCTNFSKPDIPSYLPLVESGDYRIYDDTIVISGKKNFAQAAQVLKLVNKERKAKGKKSLVMDKKLQAAAMKRAAEIALLFSHTRPNGDDCFSACASMSGENIAAGSSTASGVMKQWVNSPGHYGNIISDSFKSIGIGCINVGGMTYWVQAFSDKKGSNSQAGKGSKKGSYNVAVDYGTLNFENSGFNVGDYRKKPYQLGAGKKLKLGINIRNGGWSFVSCPADASSFTWKSSDKSIAKVSKAGVVTPGKYGGTAKITAKSRGGYTWTMKVKVKGAKKPAGAKPAKAKVASANSAAAGKLTVKTGKVAGAKGYQFKVGTNKALTKNAKAKTTTKRTHTFSGLKHGKKYYVKVRAYKKNGSKKIWGSWSKVKSVTVKR